MYVHHGARLVYLANPRTASRATAQALQEVGFIMVGSHHSGPEDEPGEDVSGFVRFSTVRDVAETLRSWARHCSCTVLEFLDIYLPAQRAIIASWPEQPWTLFPHARGSTALLPYGDLEPSLNRLLRIHGVAPVTLERIGA